MVERRLRGRPVPRSWPPELHNHAFDDDPRLFYMHFWANDDAAKLAQALHTAVAAQKVTPAT